jgi:hypothetical protein
MLNQKLIWLFLLSNLTISSCKFRPPPKRELCASAESRDFEIVCNDPRRNEPNYIRDINKGDICTNPSAYADFKNYCATLRTDLKKCLRTKKP